MVSVLRHAMVRWDLCAKQEWTTWPKLDDRTILETSFRFWFKRKLDFHTIHFIFMRFKINKKLFRQGLKITKALNPFAKVIKILWTRPDGVIKNVSSVGEKNKKNPPSTWGHLMLIINDIKSMLNPHARDWFFLIESLIEAIKLRILLPRLQFDIYRQCFYGYLFKVCSFKILSLSMNQKLGFQQEIVH